MEEDCGLACRRQLRLNDVRGGGQSSKLWASHTCVHAPRENRCTSQHAWHAVSIKCCVAAVSMLRQFWLGDVVAAPSPTRGTDQHKHSDTVVGPAGRQQQSNVQNNCASLASLRRVAGVFLNNLQLLALLLRGRLLATVHVLQLEARRALAGGSRGNVPGGAAVQHHHFRQVC